MSGKGKNEKKEEQQAGDHGAPTGSPLAGWGKKASERVCLCQTQTERGRVLHRWDRSGGVPPGTRIPRVDHVGPRLKRRQRNSDGKGDFCLHGAAGIGMGTDTLCADKLTVNTYHLTTELHQISSPILCRSRLRHRSLVVQREGELFSAPLVEKR